MNQGISKSFLGRKVVGMEGDTRLLNLFILSKDSLR